MRNGIRDGLAIVACTVMAAFVHPSDAVGQQPPSSPAAATEAMPETSLTGCLKSHGASTEVAGPGGRLYTLEVTEAAAQPGTASSATGKPATGTSTTYSLSIDKAAAKGVDLEKHADHQVQLTGRLQAPSAAATATPGSANAAPAPAAKPTPGGAHNTFEVTGLKMVAAKCG